MKLQIEVQHLRVRIDEEELAQLLAHGAIETRTAFGNAFDIVFRLQLGTQATARLEGQADDWLITLPRSQVLALVARLPSREGEGFVLPGHAPGDALQLLFDVDVRDSVRRRHR